MRRDGRLAPGHPAWPRGACPLLALLLAGCGEAPPQPHGTLHGQIRPTDGTGWNGNGYDVMDIKTWDSPGGRFRVWYALAGESAVSPMDSDPRDGVPDFVNRVGVAADRTWQETISQRGFRPPLDDSVYNDGRGFGGDGRFDIYLRRIGQGSDGYRVVEACTEVPFTCAGYFVMTPTFRGSHYQSDQEGAEVLTSHELFHNVQDAYDSRQWQTWTEGTAVWNETQVFPESAQRDFIGFLPYFLDEPERPFDRSMGTGPGALYAYGAALWPQFLGERFGPQIVREIWQGSAATARGRSPHFLDVTAEVLKQRYESDLPAAWLEFTRWNLLTGKRASAGRGYALAARYPEVRVEDRLRGLGKATVQIDGLSARYLPLDPQLDAPRRLRLRLVDESDTPASGTAYTVREGKPADELPFPSGRLDVDLGAGEQLLVVISGVVRGGPSHPVTIQVEDAPTPPPPDDMASGCSLSSGRETGAGGRLPALAALLLLGLLRRRRPAPI